MQGGTACESSSMHAPLLGAPRVESHHSRRRTRHSPATTGSSTGRLTADDRVQQASNDARRHREPEAWGQAIGQCGSHAGDVAQQHDGLAPDAVAGPALQGGQACLSRSQGSAAKSAVVGRPAWQHGTGTSRPTAQWHSPADSSSAAAPPRRRLSAGRCAAPPCPRPPCCRPPHLQESPGPCRQTPGHRGVGSYSFRASKRRVFDV